MALVSDTLWCQDSVSDTSSSMIHPAYKLCKKHCFRNVSLPSVKKGSKGDGTRRWARNGVVLLSVLQPQARVLGPRLPAQLS